MLRKESEIYALLKVYGLQQRVRRAALPRLFVFRHGGGETVEMPELRVV